MTGLMEETTCLMLWILWETDGHEVVVLCYGMKRGYLGDKNEEGLNGRR